jgi:hypothetical protein
MPMLVTIAIKVVKTTSTAYCNKAAVTFCTWAFTDELSMDPAFRLALMDYSSILVFKYFAVFGFAPKLTSAPKVGQN